MTPKKLCIPVETIAQHVVALGKTGAGKSSVLRHIVEHLLGEKKRLCVIDPKGDWYGLKAAADGKGPGFPVILFGDFKDASAQDVPINEHSGRHVAELVATGNRPCVIGFRGWMPSQMTRFWVEFASTLFNQNSDELYLAIDEVHNFTPKGKAENPEVGKSIHWTNRLLAEGRGLGVVCLIASQRPQKVHNDTLTSCETLIALRVIHKADRLALRDWIEGCGDRDLAAELLDNVAALPRGTAFVWSPECGYGPKKVKFPMFETFDSFAPQQSRKQVQQSGWAEVDLSAVREKLAAVIEEAKKNDPKELRAEISRLKLELGKRTAAPGKPTEPTIVEKRVEVSVLQDDDRITLSRAFQGLQNDFAAVRSVTEKILGKMTPAREPDRMIPERELVEARKKYQLPSVQKFENGVITQVSESLGTGERKILTACAQYAIGVTRDQLGVLAGYKRSSRNEYLRRLERRGLVIAQGENLVATSAGRAALGPNFEPLPVGDALREYWLKELPDGERNVLSFLIGRHPEPIDREEIETAVGYKRSSRNEYLRRLERRGLVESFSGGKVSASANLFG